jgi:carbonic anhydrase/acetyltransferase-like protein (isoleucine patch superfamily)
MLLTSIPRFAYRSAMTIDSFSGLAPQVHPRAWVHPSAQLLGQVVVHEEASVWPTCVLRGDVGQITIGARSNVQDGTIAHATFGVSVTEVGVETTIGHRVVLHGCRVGDHCLVGMSSTLLDNARLGEWCFVAAGSLLTPGRVFEPRSFILGSPARRVREVNARELEAIDHGWRVYLELMQAHRDPSAPSRSSR